MLHVWWNMSVFAHNIILDLLVFFVCITRLPSTTSGSFSDLLGMLIIVYVYRNCRHLNLCQLGLIFLSKSNYAALSDRSGCFIYFNLISLHFGSLWLPLFYIHSVLYFCTFYTPLLVVHAAPACSVWIHSTAVTHVLFGWASGRASGL